MLGIGVLIGGEYKIEQLIGKGGMGEVYLASSIRTGKPYAVKNIRADAASSGNKLLEHSLVAEREILLRLSNAHLPRIYAVIDLDDGFLLVMDYVQGSNLDSLVRKSGAQPPKVVFNWCMQICDVLDYLHNQVPSIIYRDLKPANIILQPNGNIMLIDFGTARTLKDNANMVSDTICVGTAGFAAPEQYGGLGQSDARTDIFCLGATMYNLVTGHSPCEEPKGFCPLEMFDPALTGSPVDYIIARCIQSAPAMRYQTARELYADMDMASRGEEVFWENVQGKRQSVWMEQDMKSSGIAGGLSGLLRGGMGKSSLLRRETGVLHESEQAAPPNARQTSSASDIPFAPPLEKRDHVLDPWWIVLIACLVTVVVFFVVSILFYAMGGTGPARVTLAVTVCAMILEVISIFFSFRTHK